MTPAVPPGPAGGPYTAPMTRALLLLAALVSALALGCSKEVATADVGDCFERPSDTSAIGDFDTVNCDEPHFGEVYFKFDIADGDYPGNEAVTQQANDRCISEFETYVGVTFADSIYGIFPVTPTEETWNDADDREVICVLTALDQTDIEGSKKGANE